jgi:hypothetical protein
MNDTIVHLDRPASPSIYSPTRALEVFLSCIAISWSLVVVMFHSTMTSTPYAMFIAIAPEKTWGMIGIAIGIARLIAIVVNGNWRRTPIIRFVGASTGAVWWLAVTGLFWLAVVKDGANAFPMLGGYPVLMIFEFYSCYRCGQDAHALQSFSMTLPRRPVAHVRPAAHG